jgi:hypothetical protein
MTISDRVYRSMAKKIDALIDSPELVDKIVEVTCIIAKALGDAIEDYEAFQEDWRFPLNSKRKRKGDKARKRRAKQK